MKKNRFFVSIPFTIVFLCCFAFISCSRTYTDGTYKGDTSRGLRHGQGTMNFKNGNVYTGAWVDDKMNGSGTMHYANNDVYEGQWQADVPSGQGIMRYANGETYEGTWVGGLRQGKGILRYSDGDAYSGEWEANQKKSCQDLGTQITTMPGLPEVVYEGSVQTSISPKSSKLCLTIPGKLSLRPINNKCFAFCMKTLKIHANGRVPLSALNMDLADSGMPYITESITISDISMELSKVDGPTILAGKDGAVLEKVGAGFRLIKGRAYFCQSGPEVPMEAKK